MVPQQLGPQAPVLRAGRKAFHAVQQLLVSAKNATRKRHAEKHGRQNQIVKQALCHFQKSQILHTTRAVTIP